MFSNFTTPNQAYLIPNANPYHLSNSFLLAFPAFPHLICRLSLSSKSSDVAAKGRELVAASSALGTRWLWVSITSLSSLKPPEISPKNRGDLWGKLRLPKTDAGVLKGRMEDLMSTWSTKRAWSQETSFINRADVDPEPLS